MTSIIILALIAFFLGLKLFSIFGQKRNFDRSNFSARGRCGANQNATKPAIKEVEVKLAKTTDPMTRLKILCPTFDKKKFLKQSKDLYKSILKFYADGDTHSLSDVINIEMMRKFAYKITQREDRNVTCKITMMKVKEAVIENISFTQETVASLKIVFNSEVIHYTENKKNQIRTGNKTRIDKRKDVWTFSRDVSSTASPWKLVEVNKLF